MDGRAHPYKNLDSQNRDPDKCSQDNQTDVDIPWSFSMHNAGVADRPKSLYLPLTKRRRQRLRLLTKECAYTSYVPSKYVEQILHIAFQLTVVTHFSLGRLNK